MDSPILITGFGPFGDVRENGSQRLVESLAARPPEGLALEFAILPVEFGAVGSALRQRVAAVAPSAIVATGVHRKESLRIERRGRRLAGQGSDRTDNAGRRADDDPLPAGGADEWATTVDLAAALAAADAAGDLHPWISDDAGGYVCERACYHVLEQGAALGVPALFVHVPPLELCTTERLRPPMEAILRLLDPGRPGSIDPPGRAR